MPSGPPRCCQAEAIISSEFQPKDLLFYPAGKIKILRSGALGRRAIKLSPGQNSTWHELKHGRESMGCDDQL